MGWEKRKRGRGRGYYYHSLRTPEGIRKVYYGRGTAGHEKAAEVERRKQARVAARKMIEAEAAATAEADRLTGELSDWAEVLVAAWMITSGHHRHKGQWRFRR